MSSEFSFCCLCFWGQRWNICAAACPGAGSVGFCPPVIAVIFLVVAVAVRLQTWESETVSPLTQLVIFPGVTGVALLLGIYLGWRFWKYLWSPKIIDDLR